MSPICHPYHVFREPLPDGFALYPLGPLWFDAKENWLADESVLAHVDRLDAPMAVSYTHLTLPTNREV